MTTTRNKSAHTRAKAGVGALDDMFQPFNRSDAPGLVVGVAQHGKVLYRRGFGLASIEHATANTPATRMRIASISKHFACLAALLLVEEGKLDIDAPVTQYLPELPPIKGVPTLRQFMTHTSGYRCYADLLMIAAGLAVHPAGRALGVQMRQTGVNFAPGEGQIYCNGGYHLLSIAIQRVAGIPFEQFLADRIFTPLGMRDTESVPSDMVILPGVATLHVPVPAVAGGGWRRGIFMTEETRGEGGIISTVDDMLAWMAHLRSAVQGQPRVGSRDSWQQMVTPARLDNGIVSPYALGLGVNDYRGVGAIRHSGGVWGALSQMITVPAHALDIIIMTNGAAAIPGTLATRIIDTLLAEQLTAPPPRRPKARRFKHLVGAQYHSPRTGMRFGFERVGQELAVSMFGPPALPLLRDEGKTLRIGFEDLSIGPFVWKVTDLVAGRDGSAPATLPFTDAGVADRLERLPAIPPDTAKAGRALVGRYRSPDLGAVATIAFEGAQLVMRFLGDYGVQAVSLKALSANAFRGQPLDPMLPQYLGFTARRKGQRVTGFELSTGRTRQLRFEREA